jgi:hypothetical protein
MKKTAVEWLIEQVNHKGVVYNNYHITTDIPKEIIEKAKAMERQQTVDAVKYGYSDWGSAKNAEQYYNETYKGGDK